MKQLSLKKEEKLENKTIFIDYISSLSAFSYNKLWSQWNLLSLTMGENPISILKSIKFKTFSTWYDFINKIREDMNLNYTSDDFNAENPINSESWHILKLWRNLYLHKLNIKNL